MLLAGASACYVLRVLCYTVFEDPWLVLLVTDPAHLAHACYPPLGLPSLGMCLYALGSSLP